MKLPQTITDSSVKIDCLVPGGQGIATTKEGIKGFFWGALPGEIVKKYEITKKKSHYFEAIALEIENPSPHRIAPKDPCYLSTSPWQIMDYDYELAQKSELLMEIMEQHRINTTAASEINTFSPAPVSRENVIHWPAGGTALRANPSGASGIYIFSLAGKISAEKGLSSLASTVQTDCKDFHYRNKMEYSLYYDFEDEKLHLAFRKRGTHRKIKVETSSIERPEIFKRASEIVDELNRTHADGRKYQSLLLRCNQAGKVEGGLYENHQPHPIFNNLSDQILGETYSYSPNGFFQINLPVYEMALTEIKKYIKTEKVLDLYAGVGTIGLSVASDKSLTLVEVDKSAYAELEKNTKQAGNPRRAILGWPENGVPPEEAFSEGKSSLGVNFRDRTPKYPRDEPACQPLAILSKSEEATDFIEPDQTVIVDPPRAGLDQKLVEKLLEIRPETIIYLSCNPATQARDIKFLLEKYQITKIQPFNFFPRTPHLENLIILERK